MHVGSFLCPTVLVYADGGRVVQASTTAKQEPDQNDHKLKIACAVSSGESSETSNCGTDKAA